jgi:hypothetical protein
MGPLDHRHATPLAMRARRADTCGCQQILAGRPGRSCGCCAAGPGTTTSTTRARRTATTTIPITATTTSGFVWCVSPTSNGASTRATACSRGQTPRASTGNACRSRSAGRGDAPGMAQARPVRTARPWGVRRAHIERGRLPGLGPKASLLSSRLANTPPQACGLDGERAAWRNHPPSNRPISATIALTCSYWPVLIHCQWCARRR